jgi:hypothetical protein
VYPAGTAPRPHAATSIGGRAITYDAAGNTLAGLGRSFTWDEENRPGSITKAGVTVGFTYGPDGERVRKDATVPPAAGCPAPPAGALNTTWTFGPDMERDLKWACKAGAWAQTSTWTKYPLKSLRQQLIWRWL